MPSKTYVTIVGNLGSDPELRYTPTGQALCVFSVAVTPRFMRNNEWQDGDTTWYRINAWRDLGENCAESLTSGMRVIVCGALENRPWETKEGETRHSLEITADAVGPDLVFAHAKVIKAERRFQESEPQQSAPAPLGRNSRPQAQGRPAGKQAASTRRNQSASQDGPPDPVPF